MYEKRLVSEGYYFLSLTLLLFAFKNFLTLFLWLSRKACVGCTSSLLSWLSRLPHRMTCENPAYLSWPLLPGWAPSRRQPRAWRKQPAGAWVLVLVSEESVWRTRQTCKEDGSHCDRKPTLAGGCRAGPPGLKLQLCPWVTSERP